MSGRRYPEPGFLKACGNPRGGVDMPSVDAMSDLTGVTIRQRIGTVIPAKANNGAGGRGDLALEFLDSAAAAVEKCGPERKPHRVSDIIA